MRQATIRPEDISISSSKDGDESFEAALEIVQPTGSETILQLRHEDTLITILRPGFVDFDWEKSYWLKIDPEMINLFDPTTSKNLKPLLV